MTHYRTLHFAFHQEPRPYLPYVHIRPKKKRKQSALYRLYRPLLKYFLVIAAYLGYLGIFIMLSV